MKLIEYWIAKKYHDFHFIVVDGDQSIVDSGVTEGEKNTASFLFRESTKQHKHEAKKQQFLKSS